LAPAGIGKPILRKVRTGPSVVTVRARLPYGEVVPHHEVAGVPGATETPALRELLESRAPEMRQQLIDRTRLRRMCTPGDIADTAVLLASDAASFITGKYFEIDGGPVDEISQRFPDL
jgi:7-alpha-hydroxysteroid dehydrogenase